MNAKEALKQLIEGQRELLAEIARLDKRIDALAEDSLDFDLDDAAPAAPPAAPPKPPASPGAPPELPENWHAMSEEQQHAWLRAHTGLTPPAEQEAEWETFEIEEGSGVSFPVPPDHLREAWTEAAPAIFENWVMDHKKGIIIDGTLAGEAYAKAGPLWLAAYAHDFLMGLPVEWRRAMVAQVNEYAPQAALELGRDILRASFDQANDRAYDVALWHADQRPTAHG